VVEIVMAQIRVQELMSPLIM